MKTHIRSESLFFTADFLLLHDHQETFSSPNFGKNFNSAHLHFIKSVYMYFTLNQKDKYDTYFLSEL